MTTDHCGVNWLCWKFMPPNRFAIVATTPIRLRAERATTRMLRMISYSAGSPTSKKPITCSSAPQVNATPRNTSSTSERAVDTLRIGRGRMPNVSRASRAASVNGCVSWIRTSTRDPPRASISSRMLTRFERVCTNGSGTSGLMNAWMKTGRSAGNSSRSSRVSSLSEWSCSAVTSMRTLRRDAITPRLIRATPMATARTAWWSHIG